MKEIFGKTKQGETVYLFTLSNANGIQAKISNYGGLLHSLLVPDKHGFIEDVLLGFDVLDGYLSPENPYFGCIVGRVANRISNGRFVLENLTYQLPQNAGNEHLHGGLKGFDKQIWNATEISEEGNEGVELHLLSPDGDENYPGNLSVTVRYLLSNHNELKISYFAVADKATPVNLTNHAYFNLSGNCKRNVLNHQLKIEAQSYTEINEQLVPTGQILPVEETAFDFRNFKQIGDDIEKTIGGFDHNFILDGKGLRKVAEVVDNESGRILELYTTMPGMQLYSGNFLNPSIVGKNNKPYQKHDGFCLETQFFPDSVNRPEFPSCILKPGELYEHQTIFRFPKAG